LQDRRLVGRAQELVGKYGWTNTNPSWPAFDQITVNLAAYAGIPNTRFRFRLGTDERDGGRRGRRRDRRGAGAATRRDRQRPAPSPRRSRHPRISLRTWCAYSAELGMADEFYGRG